MRSDMLDRQPVRLLAFPAADVGLRREAEAALRELPEDLDDEARLRALRDHLRRWYRAVEVRCRSELGGYDGEPISVWYIYRDGRVRIPNQNLERLYRALGSARQTCRTSAAAIDSAWSVAERAGYAIAVAHPPATRSGLSASRPSESWGGSEDATR